MLHNAHFEHDAQLTKFLDIFLVINFEHLCLIFEHFSVCVLQISSLFVSILRKDDRVYVPKVGRTISFVLGIWRCTQT